MSEINVMYRRLVCAFLYMFNSDLISSKHLPVEQEIVLEFQFITRVTVQMQSQEKNQTNLYIYESGIHLKGYITSALSALMPLRYGGSKNS